LPVANIGERYSPLRSSNALNHSSLSSAEPMSPVSLMEASGLWDWCHATDYR